ncbi:PDR/VanB family oxidoreductase [Ramlibacter sp.]|uniref:PDR/VanB family oxidoreductase n=1 Tax=Ramlibacter sp. TaxID=1917967 RepID=UPI003D131C7E
MDVRVQAKRVEATDIVVLELAALQGHALPPFSAGSHIDIEVRPGLARQYSLCNDPSETHRYVVAILREPLSRGGSSFIHAGLNEGDTVRIGAPKNHFPLQSDGQRHVLFAGGIGITPLLCMSERLARTDKAFALHYCVRSADRAAFRARLAAPDLAARVHVHRDDGDAAQKLDVARALGAYTPGAHAYVCGPGGFIAWVLDAARQAGWPEGALHREYFTPPDTGVAAAPAEAFQVRLASSDRVIDIPAERSVMQVLAEAGVELPSSCEQGTCGSCLTRVLEGIPDHRDVYLTDDERAANDQFTPCVSRAKTPLLVLDI